MNSRSSSQEMPPQAILLDMLLGMMKTQAIHEAVRLNLAELVKDGPKSVHELAAETQTQTGPLHRLLRALEGIGLFAEVEEGTYGQSQLSHFLRPNIPGSMYDVAGIHGELWQWRPWEGFRYSLQTGNTAFDHLFEMPLFEYFASHPDEGVGFQKAMAGFSNQVDRPLAQAYDYSKFSTLVDIGGGFGGLLSAILRTQSQLKGILFDLPQVIDTAHGQIAASDVAERCSLVAGDMFQTQDIPQADAYIMKQVIKDWDDDAAVQILRNCRHAIRPGGKILVAEQVILPGQQMVPAKLIDLQLMVVLRGQERTESEYRALFEKADLTLAHIWPTHSPYSILEGIANDL